MKHKINDEGEIVDKDGVPILDHKGKIIVVPLEYQYHYRHYLEDD
jgi:flagellar basal body rod protein FlgG|tara:strand:- start:287 stop:421 length:135 start_codon:yes stop_codon:yes gene_type:complete